MLREAYFVFTREAGEWPARIPFFPRFGPHGAKQGKTYAAEVETDTFLLSVAGRWPEAASPLSFCPCESQPSGAKRHKLRVIKQKPRTVFSARFVCSGLPLTQTNENDFLAFQKREPNPLQPTRETAAKRV